MRRSGLLTALLFALAAAHTALVGHAGQAAPQRGSKPALRLTSPRGGETWGAASKHTITWEGGAPAAGGTVKVEYTTDHGKTWHEAAAAAPNTGRFLWKVPGRVSTGCKVRVSQRPKGKHSESLAPFAIVPSQEVRDYEWVPVTKQAAFAPRDGAGALVFRGRMWLLGGWNPGDRKHFPRICNNEVWSSADGAAWTPERPNTFLDRTFDATRDWEGRHTAGYVVYKGRMWIVGGDVNQGHYHFDVWNSADGKRWAHVNNGRPVPWGPRALHHTLVFGGKIWVLGGQTMPSFARAKEVFYRDAWHTSDGVNWQRVRPREPYWSARGMIGGSAAFKGRMWVLGGGTYETQTTPARKFYNDVWSSADGVDWRRHVESAPWEPRQYHDVAVFDDLLWVLEGYAGGNRNDVWYSADGVNWYEVPETPWRPRHAASVFVHDGALWLAAGNNMESDVWKLRRKPPGRRGGMTE
jgi:hypothetical protein